MTLSKTCDTKHAKGVSKVKQIPRTQLNEEFSIYLIDESKRKTKIEIHTTFYPLLMEKDIQTMQGTLSKGSQRTNNKTHQITKS